MTGTKADIIAQLQRDILPLQRFKTTLNNIAVDALPLQVKDAFPHAEFPLGAVHEFIYTGAEGAAATGGFVAGILASLICRSGACIWISSSRLILPPDLKFFGIALDKIIFIDLKKEKEILWAMEEAL